jgi:hypothetical protein
MTDADERIRMRAYEKWLQDGMPDGRDRDHWAAAEAEITADGEVRQFAQTGDPVQTTHEASRQDKPEITEYRQVMPEKERADSEKAPITPQVFAPNQSAGR